MYLMPYVIAICTSPKIHEIAWRLPLSQQGVVLNIKNGHIPDIKSHIDHCPGSQKIILLVTGGHGSLAQGVFNEADLTEWRKWIATQPKGKIDLIILDFCDSTALIKEKMCSLLTASGSVISNISTSHGLRSHLIESKFSHLGKIALTNFLFNSLLLLKGSNICITKKRESTSLLHRLLCVETESILYDDRVPIDLDGDNENLQRKKMISHIKETNKLLTVLPKPDIALYIDNIDKQLNPRISKIKLGFFTATIVMTTSAIVLKKKLKIV